MKIYEDLDLLHFDGWCGAEKTLGTLDTNQIETVESILEDAYPDGMDRTELNDLLRFEQDEIADWLGFKSWEALERYNDKGPDITVRIFNIDWDFDCNEDGSLDTDLNLPSEIIHTFEDGCYEGDRDDDLLDEAADWLSNEYGFCHNSFDIEEVND